jgi:UDP-N-acetylmuramoyl-tripeptide--D-alanyl-D-alanine ligase
MCISNFGEMDRLSKIAKPDICVITNIGPCHLEFLGSRQGVLKAKTEIFHHMNKEGSVCVNGDDDMLITIESVHGNKPIRFGFSEGNDVYATDVENHGLFGTTCNIHVNQQVFQANIPLPGEHMVRNALAATAVGTLLDLNLEEIAKGIHTVQSVGGRSNIIRHQKYTIIDDCYNANPVSMKAAIDLLKTATTNKVAILGDMGELGSNENALHKEVGEYAALANIDVLVCVGKRSIHMYEGAKEVNFMGNLLYFETRDELIAALSTIVKENDTVLIRASHSMGFEKIVEALNK